MIDNTRAGSVHQKKGVSIMAVQVDSEQYANYAAADDYLVGILPDNAIITDAYVFTQSASNAGAVTLGTTAGGSEVMSAGDSTATGKSGTFTGATDTGTGKSLYMGIAAAATQGEFVVIVEYIEYTLNTGNLTKIN